MLELLEGSTPPSSFERPTGYGRFQGVGVSATQPPAHWQLISKYSAPVHRTPSSSAVLILRDSSFSRCCEPGPDSLQFSAYESRKIYNSGEGRHELGPLTTPHPFIASILPPIRRSTPSPPAPTLSEQFDHRLC